MIMSASETPEPIGAQPSPGSPTTNQQADRHSPLDWVPLELVTRSMVGISRVIAGMRTRLLGPISAIADPYPKHNTNT